LRGPGVLVAVCPHTSPRPLSPRLVSERSWAGYNYLFMVEIIPTNTCPPDLAELSRRSELIASFSPAVQLDVSDGKFTAETSWPFCAGQEAEQAQLAEGSLALPHIEKLAYEAHLMVEEPLEIGSALIRAGASRIIAHMEAFADEREILHALALWKGAHGSEVGLALLLDTPLLLVDAYVAQCDVVQLMSIATLGYQGAPYEPRVIPRIKELREKYPELTIEIDGGVSEKNVADLALAGARRFGVGSAIMKASDPASAYENLKNLAQSAL